MASDKSERLLNLLIMLLVTRHWIPKGRIREVLYPGSTEAAFEKMFERDKEELRSIGVPVEVGALDNYFDDEVGYRVRPERFALPEVTLTAEEASVVALAGRAWDNARLADHTTRALATLTAAGVELDRSALDLVEPRLRAEEPSFEAFWTAVTDGTPVRFDYRRSPGDAPRPRRLEPWGVVRSSGRWYVAGHDRDRDEPRVFRLSRVVGEVAVEGHPGEVVVPDGTEVGQLTRNLVQPTPGVPATVLVRTGSGHGLRRAARTVSTGVAGPDGTTSWDRLELPDSGSEVADEVLAHGADAYVEGPPDLRETVLRRVTEALDALVAAGDGRGR
ncbi:WYL domain-containing protein [uncultured Nocardioides sp.]|uniref:helix-turn-helix transcriptional regulator n=1 Tax=uncultured Nocardioides sp. TaxID=198441 RepID=UPI002609EAEE|nr:WYL domain-containing protein [uncultured Nocardioides sp.]